MEAYGGGGGVLRRRAVGEEGGELAPAHREAMRFIE